MGFVIAQPIYASQLHPSRLFQKARCRPNEPFPKRQRRALPWRKKSKIRGAFILLFEPRQGLRTIQFVKIQVTFVYRFITPYLPDSNRSRLHLQRRLLPAPGEALYMSPFPAPFV